MHKLDRSSFQEISEAAKRRLDEAKSLFNHYMKQLDLKEQHKTVELIPPNVHLVNACWKSFKHYVEKRGCTAKRRKCSDEEKAQYGEKKRKGSVYFVSVTFTQKAVKMARANAVPAVLAVSKSINVAPSA